MNASKLKKNLLFIYFILIGFFVLSGCIKRHQMDVVSIPSEVIPKNVTVSIYFNSHGDLVMADKDGVLIESKPIPFSTLLKKADRKEPGWIELLGSYSLFQIGKDSRIWLCDKEFQCVEAQVKSKSSRPIFSVNYNNATGKVFVSDSQGGDVRMVAKAAAVSTDKPQYLNTMDIKMGQEKVRTFTDLIENTDLSSVKDIRVLRTAMLFKVKGSNMFVDYNPLTGSVSFGCIDSNGKICAPISPWCCPPGLCP